MVNISKLGDSTIKFTFTDNDRYLYNGEITLPLNSLILEFDTSDLVIFKKIDGDVFVTFLLENSNFGSKDSLIEFYKTSMVSSGGGGGGVTPEEFEAYSAATDSRIAEDEEVTAAALVSLNNRVSEDEEVTAAGLNSLNEAVSGKADANDVYTKTEADTLLLNKADATALGGLSLVKLTESEYAALVDKDPNVLYVVIPDPINP